MTKKPKPFVGWALTHISEPNNLWGMYRYKRDTVAELFECYDFQTLKEAKKSGHSIIKVKITPLTGEKR